MAELGLSGWEKWLGYDLLCWAKVFDRAAMYDRRSLPFPSAIFMEGCRLIAGEGLMRLRNYPRSGGNEKTCGRVSGGFQMELGIVSTGIGLVGFRASS